MGFKEIALFCESAKIVLSKSFVYVTMSENKGIFKKIFKNINLGNHFLVKKNFFS